MPTSIRARTTSSKSSSAPNPAKATDRISTVIEKLKAAWAAGSDDNIGIVAAGIAHYALLALVPALGALVLGYGLIVDPETVARHIGLLAENLPSAAAELIGSQIESVSEGKSGAKGLGLIVALAVAIFGARNGARALMTGLNIAFHAKEDRGLIKANLMAVAITVAGLVGFIVVGIGSAALASFSGLFGSLVSLVFTGLVAFGAAALLYRFAPNKPAPDWAAIRPAAALFALSWLVATAAFAFYAANFGDYNATYGALGAVLALITWFWATGFLLLLGGELAALLNREGRPA